MLPHVPGTSQNGPVFCPDNLLVNERVVPLPDGLEERLFPTGVPAIPGRVGCDRELDCHTDERIVQSFAECRTVDVRILVGPVLVLAPLYLSRVVPLVWMIGAVVVDQIRRVGREQARAHRS